MKTSNQNLVKVKFQIVVKHKFLLLLVLVYGHVFNVFDDFLRVEAILPDAIMPNINKRTKNTNRIERNSKTRTLFFGKF